jgi:ferredoxin
VKYIEKGFWPYIKKYFVQLRCNHCENAPCVRACPVEALFRRRDGLVDLDQSRCIGCKACIAACLYDAIYINPMKGVAEKCNACAYLVDASYLLACALVCPTLLGEHNHIPIKALVAWLVRLSAYLLWTRRLGDREMMFIAAVAFPATIIYFLLVYLDLATAEFGLRHGDTNLLGRAA